MLLSLLDALAPGDHIFVEFERLDGTFAPILAIFDDEEEVFFSTENLVYSRGVRFTGLIDETIRHGPGDYFFAVTHRHDDIALGAYRFNITIYRGQAVPPPATQVLLLDFDGGSLDVPLLGISEVAPFEAANISPIYTGDTETSYVPWSRTSPVMRSLF